jgi:hypothetical protein
LTFTPLLLIKKNPNSCEIKGTVVKRNEHSFRQQLANGIKMQQGQLASIAFKFGMPFLLSTLSIVCR